MEKEILISVIIPIYNTQKYLDRCISSIVNQTYKNLEIILVDDGSTDSSRKKCDEWIEKDKRIIVIHKNNGGVSSARNSGLKKAKGDYITFVDSDDYLDKDCYSNLKEIINKKYDLIKFQNYTETKKYKRKSSNSISGELNKSKILDLFFKYHELGPIWTTLFKKEIIKDLEFNNNWKFGEDYYFYLESILKSNLIYISNDAYYHYVVNEESATHKADITKYLNSFKTHYEVDYFVYEKMTNSKYNNYKTELLECTYNISINLLKQVATNYSYKQYKQLIDEVIKSDYYTRYRKLDKDFKKKEFTKIIEKKNYLFFLKSKINGKIKKIIKRILS